MNPSKLSAATLLALVTACTGTADGLEPGEGDFTKGGAFGKADASVEAIFVDFEFEGEVIADSAFGAAGKIEDQLLYTIGHLNHDNSVGRLDQLQLSNVQSESTPDGRVRLSYHARMPVAWGQRDNIPTSYAMRLPADISFAGQNAFTSKYNERCVDFGAHDVTAGSMWYYYRPERSGCSIDEADIVRVTADVSVSEINTSGKYPEYHEVWEDDVLQVVAVFGKYEDGATGNSDAGISAYNRFVRTIGTELSQFDLVTEPAEIPFNPGIELPDVVFSAALPDGRAVEVTALLVDNVRTAPASFNARYGELSSAADLIVYNGHAGLGANIRSLASKGQWVEGQYAIVFMNGCDTYAYIDSALNDAHAAVNVDDPNGTKYLDIVTNAMPSFFHEMPAATMALVRGLLSYDDPQTYEQMFVDIDADEVVLVSGEQDNVFVPGFGEDDDDDVVDAWEGLQADGTVVQGGEDHLATPRLAAGRYQFTLSGNNDADLYVRTGAAPTDSTFECRPFKTGSAETCVVELTTEATIHVMVRGWAASSDYTLVGEQL
jgi:hypothetical protein